MVGKVKARVKEIEADIIKANAENNIQTKTQKKTKSKTKKTTESNTKNTTENNPMNLEAMQGLFNMFMSNQANSSDRASLLGVYDDYDDDDDDDDDVQQDKYSEVFKTLIKSTNDATEILKSAYTIHQFLTDNSVKTNNVIRKKERKQGANLLNRLKSVLTGYSKALKSLDAADDKLKDNDLISMRSLADKYWSYSLDWVNVSSNQIIDVAVEKANKENPSFSYEAFRNFITNSILDISQLRGVLDEVDMNDDVIRAIINDRYAFLANKTRETVIELDESVKQRQL